MKREIYKGRTKKGYVYYYMFAIDTIEIFGGCGICDDCGKFANMGIYVPVLNHYMCVNCYKSFVKSCKYYSEDKWFEDLNIKYVDSKINKSEYLKLYDRS